MRLRTVIGTLLALAAAGGIALYVVTLPEPIRADELAAYTPDVANGETMFNAGGCASCHKTPNQDDQTKLGGGVALATQFGTFHAPNISPDPKNGIGAWSEAQFASAMLRGVGPNGEHLYPVFPYTSYQRMALKDVRDLFAYLKTLPPVATPSQPHQLSFPFDVRTALGPWKLLFLDGRAFAPDPAKDAVYNRGAYLVEGLGHCAECHSQRNILGAIDQRYRLAGGPNPTGKGWIPNITQTDDGLGKWTVKDIAYLLETGFTAQYDAVGSSMAEVVENTGRLSEADRNAMAVYLKALPARPSPPH